MARRFGLRFDWSALERIRNRWRGRLVVRGVLDVQDAVSIASIGTDAIVVSFHEGRQSDGASPPPDVLPVTATAVGRRLEVLVDGGVRTGEDVFEAVALGAKGDDRVVVSLRPRRARRRRSETDLAKAAGGTTPRNSIRLMQEHW